MALTDRADNGDSDMHPPKPLAKPLLVLVFFFSLGYTRLATAQSCGTTGLVLQVLGSGGPELQDKRASI